MHTLTLELAPSALIAFAILVHAWTPRIVTTATTGSTIGWIQNLLLMVFLVLAILR